MKRLQGLLGALCIFSATLAAAQDWPSRPVRLVVPFPAGGSTDVAARTLAERLSRSLGAQFVVENRAGGGGVVGISEVARAAPDGYTVVVAPDAITTLPVVVKELPFDVLRDFVAVTQITTQPLAVAVHAGAAVMQDDGASLDQRFHCRLRLVSQRPGAETPPPERQLRRLQADEAHLAGAAERPVEDHRVPVDDVGDRRPFTGRQSGRRRGVAGNGRHDEEQDGERNGQRIHRRILTGLWRHGSGGDFAL